MKRKLTALLLGTAIMLAAGSAWCTPIQLIKNGDFSAGLNFWTPSDGNVQVVSTPALMMTGNYARFGFNPNSGTRYLYQDFNVSGMNTLDVSFNYMFNYRDNSTNLTDTFIALYAQGVVNPLAVVTLQNLQSQDSSGSGTSTLAGIYVSPTLDISAIVGTTGQVKFTLVEAAGNSTDSYAGIDNVSVFGEAAPVPEPGTMVLLGFGMLGLAIYGKRRMNKEA